MVKIKRLYERTDDNYDILIGEPRPFYEYTEVNVSKQVINGFEESVYIIMPKAFYRIVPTHIPKDMSFSLNEELLISGILCNYNKERQEIFLYNCTHNHIYIKEDTHIGVTYDG